MTNPMIRTHDVSTNTTVEREMTDEEVASYEADQSENQPVVDEVIVEETPTEESAPTE